MDVSEIRTAIIGYGLAGSVFHAPLVAATPGMRVSGIVTGNPRRQEEARAAFPEAAILPSADNLWQQAGNFDLVVVATPNRFHVPLALRSIEAGVPVVVDKPLAASAVDGRRLIEAAESRRVPVTVFQNRRWDGDFRTVQALEDADLLGPLARFESRFERYRPAPKEGAWRERPEPEEAGGLLFDLGSHLIDQAMVLFGEPLAVYAEVNVRRPGALVDDDTFVSLDFPGGMQAHLWMSVVPRDPGPRFVVAGLRGMYTKMGLDPQEPFLKDGGRPGDPEWGLEPPAAWGRISTETGGVHIEGSVETLPGCYESFYAQVAGALRTGAPLPVDPRDSLRVLEIIEAAKQSAAERRVISLIP
jgi:scyllo-inositol 2-dehydrogenase (NADP+)